MVRVVVYSPRSVGSVSTHETRGDSLGAGTSVLDEFHPSKVWHIEACHRFLSVALCVSIFLLMDARFFSHVAVPWFVGFAT